jgi:hypothetical protein
MQKPRTTEPERRQGTICFSMPEDTLDADHPARVLWQALGGLDLSAFLAGARSLEGHAGRSSSCEASTRRPASCCLRRSPRT